MLKNMKAKALALFAVLVLAVGALCTATPAMAAGSQGPLTVQSSKPEFAGKKVSAWKMFDIEVSGTDPDFSYSYTLDDAWKNFFMGDSAQVKIEGINEENLSTKAYEYIKSLTDNDGANNDSGDLADFAKKAAAWAETNLSANDCKLTDATATSDAAPYKATFSAVDFGYYVVSPQAGSTDVDEPLRHTDAMLVSVTTAAGTTWEMKSVYPTVDKTVEGGSAEKPGNHASAEVGDTLTFKLTSTVPDPSEWDHYQFMFTDTLSKGLTFNNDVKVSIGNTPLTANTQYKVKFTDGNGTGNSKLVINLGAFDDTDQIYDAKDLFSGNIGKTITVTYTVTVNEHAIIATDDPNTVNVGYTNGPDTDDLGTSEDKKTHQYTFGFDVHKVDGTEGSKFLSGAEFELRATADGDGIQLISDKNATSPTYRPAKETGEGAYEDGATTVAAVGTDGKLHFTGLKEGVYYLVETKAPDGYNVLTEPVIVKIAASYDTDGTLINWTAKIVKSAEETVTPAVGNSHTITVKNNKGTLLPGTGGMGTVIFTVVGVAVIAGGAAWYVSRRRSSGAHNA